MTRVGGGTKAIAGLQPLDFVEERSVLAARPQHALGKFTCIQTGMPEFLESAFFVALKKSGVVPPERLSSLESDSDADPKSIAIQLVREGWLTNWQARFLLSGRDNLTVGKYVLLERLSQNELGDRFRAHHQQLDRPVDLQLLPPELSENESVLKSFIRQATIAARLDCPALIHVYDVDQFAGRYYVVSEHFESSSLQQVIDAREHWELYLIGNIARQLIDGIKALRAHDVVHGKLSLSCLYIDTGGTAKIGNLAYGPWLHTSSSANPSDLDVELVPEDDLVQLGQAMVAFLDRCGHDGEPVKRQQLRILFDQLSRIRDWEGELELVEQNLNKWLQRNRPPDPGANRNDAPGTPNQTTDENHPTLAARWRAGWSRLSTANRVGVVTIAVACLAIIVGLAWRRPTPPSPVVHRNDAALKQTNAKAEGANEPKTDPEGPTLDAAPTKAFTPGRIPQELLTEPDPPANPSVTETKTEPANSGEAGATSSTDAVTDANSKDGANEGTQPVANMTAASQKTATGTETENKTPAVAPEAEAHSSKAAEMPAASPQDSEPLPPPFATMPWAVELPSIDVTSPPMLLGPVVTGPNDLLGVTLVCDPAFTRRIEFKLQRGSDSGSQSWQAMAESRGAKDPIPIARVWLEKGQFYFQWTDQAATDLNHNYLRNCLLKLECRNDFHYLPLRAPVKLGAIVLSEENPEAKVDFDLEWIPDRKLITVELISIGDVNQSENPDGFLFNYEPTERIIPDRGELIAYLTQKDLRFLRLDVEAKISRRSTINAAFQILQIPKPKTYSEKLYRELEQQFQRQADEINLYLQRLEAYDPPTGEKTKHGDEVKRVKNLLEQAQMQLADLTDQYNRRSYLFGNPIKIRIHTIISEIPVDLATWDGEVTSNPGHNSPQ